MEAQPVIYARIFGRGVLIVFLTAMNIGQIAGGHYGGAFCGGFAISFVWFMNSRTAAHATATYAREAYALGAAVGTITGMWCTRWFYG